ncbi:MAG TPA: hypothetical protein VEV17_25795 [Bryobacteraceae bacterium]|nr:hypothetical protein [Bryobacteraceae bacterium]
MRKLIATLFVSTLSVWAQSSASTTTAVDVNGQRIQEGPQVVRQTGPGYSETTERKQSINGRMVPLERVEERVIRQDASGRVVERTIRRFDPQGNPTAPVRETIEEQKRPDGSSTVQTTTYRADINGSMQLAQKSIAETRKNGSQSTTESVIQKPTINGALETVEKQSDVTVKGASGGYTEDKTTYRKNADGSFYAATRESIEHTQQGSRSTDNTAQYEVGPSGQLELHSQTVSKSEARPDGSKNTVVDIFGKNVPGVYGSGALKLQEQQIIDQQKGTGDTVVQSVAVRRPSVSDANKLGPAQQLSETVCKGNCNQ